MRDSITLESLRQKRRELSQKYNRYYYRYGINDHVTQDTFNDLREFDDAIFLLHIKGILTMNEYESIVHMTTEELERQ